ncbi:hypothetical protein HMPREF0083_02501 [Aneurinibacillus aneurinilyticus ATCC 12856]|uniref:Uncharacterized protein n=1 Tax=Aneurinibacillus aneurinilyticus ATCC 12856 TaxID=649747 RepID=U1X4F8_ANEAE|nr:hypothetical protein HMPREF0083_02501 [Aneurinibacillus aneurinilyticus ATCC 12856]
MGIGYHQTQEKKWQILIHIPLLMPFFPQAINGWNNFKFLRGIYKDKNLTSNR